MKRTIIKMPILLIAIICTFALSGCEIVYELMPLDNASYTDSDQQTSIDSLNDKNASANTGSGNATTPKEPVASVEETVIYDGHDVTVTLKALKNNSDLVFNVFSNVEQDIMFMVSEVAVNNCMVYDDGAYSQYVTHGNSCSFKYNIDGRKKYGISEIRTIDIKIEFYIDYDLYEKHVQISTDLDNGEVFKPTFSNSKLCYEDENVEVFTVKTGKGIKDFELLFHNKSEHPISSYFTKIAINGIMTDNLDTWGDGAFAGGYCFTGASNDTTYTLWSALDDEIGEKGFDVVNKITGELGVWLRNEPTGDVTSFTTNDLYVDQYQVSNVTIYTGE